VKNIVFLFLCCFSVGTFAQGDVSNSEKYPTNYFRSPLDIPLVLSGTFAELRTNHFHSGLDIKTQGVQGKNVFAAADGYVSRIKIAHWGYGKALYITHPNGYTTVYAHLKKFNKKIEDYIKKQQYKKESYEIQLFPSSTTLQVKKDEIVAFSGNSGGSGGPHLHFEIRDTKSEKPINPLFFGIEIEDSKKPRINTLIGYSLAENSHINKIAIPKQLNLIPQQNGDLKASKITAFGKIGFGINAYDQLDGAYNKNGLFSLEMLVNGKKVHDFKAASFSFSESKYINLLIDYERNYTLKQRVQKCFIEPKNKLSVYKNSVNNGIITIEDGLNYNVEIIAKDFKGNTQKITIPIIGKKDSIIVKPKIVTSPYAIAYSQFTKFKQENITVSFPANAFYEDFFLNFNVKDSIAEVHEPSIPITKNYRLAFSTANIDVAKKAKMYIASINKNGYTQFVSSKKNETTIYALTKKLGKFKLETDFKKPKIELLNFKDKQWVTNFNYLKVKISDADSGIKLYRGEIDGEWVLFEYEPKSNLLTYNLNDKNFTEAEHSLKLKVTDNVGNTTILETTFFRKK